MANYSLNEEQLAHLCQGGTLFLHDVRRGQFMGMGVTDVVHGVALQDIGGLEIVEVANEAALCLANGENKVGHDLHLFQGD